MAYKLQRGKVVRRRVQVGDVIITQTFTATHTDGSHSLGWFVVPDGMSREQAFDTQDHYGPFATEAEVRESQRLVLLGPQCEVKEGGKWDPAWDKLQ